ncbi:mitotic-spindle organizing protein 1-like isoform X4 [Oratosquilla oratoria]|uniref:mitotic-spindle organizing protein 1-like isoform X3 n=1 Tax=Oratosquilla oratoria TaxID=337810 RepID=UPI003F76AE47
MEEVTMSAKGSGMTAKETFQTLMEMSKLLNTGLDETTLALCVRLCECGANPESLAKVIVELRREVAALNMDKNQTKQGQ